MSLIDRALPFSTMKSLVTPANRTIDSIGTTAALASASVMIEALAKPPGRSRPRSLGTRVSTWKVRLDESTDGLIRATLPSMATPGWARVESRTRWPTRTSSEYCSGTWLQSRIGSSITSSATASPSLIIWPSETCRLVMPYESGLVRVRLGGRSLGMGTRMIMSFKRLLGLAQGDLGRDGVGDDGARRLDRVVVVGGGGSPVVLGVIELLGRAGAALGQRTLTRQVLQGFLAGDPLLDDGGDLGDRLVGHLADQELLADAVLLDELLGLLLGDPQLDELTQVFRLGLLHAQPGVDRVELDQGLARLDPVADVVMDLDDPAGALRAQRSPAPSRAGCR